LDHAPAGGRVPLKETR